MTFPTGPRVAAGKDRQSDRQRSTFAPGFTDPPPLSLDRPSIESSNTAWYAYDPFQGGPDTFSQFPFFFLARENVWCGYTSQRVNGGVIVGRKYYGW